ncbi:MAG: transketolase family protein, partial [Sedimentisphaerales bacterium]|nr:transketolase family protein [Sedimentisphaerales bacterium]
ADVSSSTKTAIFGKKFPQRFFNVGVAEANMAGIAAGIATCGLKPVISTFAIFVALKCTDQIRNTICYNNLPVVIVGGYAGLSDSFDGASHQSITDVAILRAMPGMNVIVPADNSEAVEALEASLKINEPVYIRLCRNATPAVTCAKEPFKFGKIRRLMSGNDLTIAVCGVVTPMTIQAAQVLKEKGISVDLLEVSTIKPLDIETLKESVKRTGKVLTIEEHSIIGGLGSAVSEAISQNCPARMEFIGIEDKFAESGSYDKLLEKYGISIDAIIKRSELLMETK